MKRFEACGWHVQSVDGHDNEAIAGAIKVARADARPSLIACRTVIGKGAPNKAGSHKVHGAPLGSEEIAEALRDEAEFEPFIGDIRLTETRESWIKNLEKIQRYIYEGDTYQVNYTLRMDFQLQGEILGLYRALRARQSVDYSALLLLPDSTILSLSPELFIEKRGATLVSRPMKGTSPRGHSGQADAEIMQAMANDAKQLSENLMIVDLMRNDIGRLAKPGSMRVDRLFEIQTFETLHQMISTISGEVEPDIPFGEVIDGLFPCGSISGAPKIRTMEIIHELESTPRGVYTGAIGYITPDNDFTFSVPIRTIEFEGQTKNGRLGIGGGIIFDSKPEEEWDECLLKAKFLTGLNQDFQLIETCRYDRQKKNIPYLEAHLQRLKKSAAFFQFVLDENIFRQQTNTFLAGQNTTADLKVRILLAYDGSLSFSAEAIDKPGPETPRVCLSKNRIHSRSVFRRHKTSRRALYNSDFDAAADKGFYDVLFLNEKNQLAEASRHNLFIEQDGQLFTPPLDSGALPGVMRSQLLADRKRLVSEKNLGIADLQKADRIFLANAVRGLLEVSFIA